MKIDDLQNSTNEDLNQSDNLEKDLINSVDNNENEAKESANEHVEEKLEKESAAEILLRKVQQRKAQNSNDIEDTSKLEPEQETLTKKEVEATTVETTTTKVPEEEHPEIVETDIKESETLEEKPDEVEQKVDEEVTEVAIEKVDYTTLSHEELVEELHKLTEQDDIYSVKDNVETIKTQFYKILNAQTKEQKAAFVEKGGEEANFKADANPLEEKFKAYYSVFKEKRTEQLENIEKEKQENLNKKYQIIDKIGELITGKESLNQTFHDFKELQKQWQDIGLVPQSDVKKLWDSYNYQVEKFYDYVKINKDLRDLDLKKNMQIKISLCERAEELLMESNIVSAFRDLQKLHEQWRETGPVVADKKEELWDRFKQATAKINKKHQEYFDNLKQEQVNNLKGKTLLCEKVEEILTLDLKTYKEWEENSREIIELQRLWKLIGFAPKKDNNKIYERFRKACDTFFDAKREYYSKNKEVEENNLQIKIELCNQAESMMDSTDWRKTTDFYINLQKKWKTIGQVPRKQKDQIWQRFRTACNTFFDKKSEHFSSRDKEEEKNLELKKQLIETVKNLELSDDSKANFKQLSELQKEWTEIGHVPIKLKDSINKEFRSIINQIYDKLDLDASEKSKLHFKSKLESLKNAPKSFGRIRNERDKIASKMDKLQGNIILWENNIGFFAKSKSSESMIKTFEEKIRKAKEAVAELKQQLRMIDNME